MKGRRRSVIWVSIVAGAGAAVWGLSSLEPQPLEKYVDVRIEADQNVCWEVFNGRVSYEGDREAAFGCGSGGTGYDDDLVAVPSSVVVRKLQGDGVIRVWFAVNDEITDSGTISEVGGSVVLSGD